MIDCACNRSNAALDVVSPQNNTVDPVSFGMILIGGLALLYVVGNGIGKRKK